MNPNKEKHDRQRAIQEKYKEREIPLELIKIQDRYNKQNLKIQHEFNLKIHKKQSRLAIFLTLLTVFCSLVTAIIGVLAGIYIERTWPQHTSGIQSQKSIQHNQYQVATMGVTNHRGKETESIGKEESSSTNVSSKSP